MNKIKLTPRRLLALVLGAFLPLAAAQAQPATAYISNQDGGVSVLDLDSLTLKPGIATGKGPRGIGISDDGKYLVTANKDDAGLTVIDRVSGEKLRHIRIGKNPEFVRVRGHLAFVTYEPSSKGGPPPKPGQPAAREEDDDDDKIPARVAVVDLKQGKKIREIVSAPETEGIEFSPDGKQLIVTNEGDNTITVHDIRTGKLKKTIPTSAFGDRPRGIKVSPDGKTYVATLEFGNKLLILNDKLEPLKTVDTGKTPYGVAFDARGERVFVAASREKTLQVFDARSFEKLKDIPTGDRCWHFTFTPDQKKILLACGKSDEILVIDTDRLEVSQRIAAQGTPWGIVTYPKSLGSLDQP